MASESVKRAIGDRQIVNLIVRVPEDREHRDEAITSICDRYERPASSDLRVRVVRSVRETYLPRLATKST